MSYVYDYAEVTIPAGNVVPYSLKMNNGTVFQGEEVTFDTLDYDVPAVRTAYKGNIKVGSNDITVRLVGIRTARQAESFIGKSIRLAANSTFELPEGLGITDILVTDTHGSSRTMNVMLVGTE